MKWNFRLSFLDLYCKDIHICDICKRADRCDREKGCSVQQSFDRFIETPDIPLIEA